MARHIAFLRGMNVGGHRITNADLSAHFGGLGFSDVACFLASGNVVFDATGDLDELEERIEAGLRDALGYAVPTFLRTAEGVRRIAAHEPFAPDELAATAGRVQVALLRHAPQAGTRRAILGHATAEDRLRVDGSELYWLPREGISTSALDLGGIERAAGLLTVRTHRTLRRLARRFLDGGEER